MVDKLPEVTFTYTKDGKTVTQTMRVEPGVVIDFNNQEGQYINSFTVNKDGKFVPVFGDKKQKKPLEQLELTEAEINKIMQIERNNDDGGLTKKDYEKEEIKRVHRAITNELKENKPWWKFW